MRESTLRVLRGCHAGLIVALLATVGWGSGFVAAASAANEAPPFPSEPGLTSQHTAACCSSVLFLPGFAGSRLVREGWLGTTQLWEPRVGAVWRLDDLAMDPETGVAPNSSVVASEVIAESNVFGVQTSLGFNMYKGFLERMEELVAQGVIREFRPFAYDWREALPQLVHKPHRRLGGEEEDLVAVVRELAQRSHTGRVTIVAHSMGGLVAKLLTRRLEALGEADIVDRIIFVGTPHAGAPKAIAALLHGFDGSIGGGLVLRQRVARDLLRTMESAYTLLPFFSYPREAPLISFLPPSDSLQQEGPPIPASISSWFFNRSRRPPITPATLDDFISFPMAFPPLGDLREIEAGPTDIPLAVNTTILQTARAVQTALASWRAPEGVEVINIVGTGLPTPVGFRYMLLPEYGFLSSIGADEIISPEHLRITKWRFVVEPVTSTDGDGTVPTASASFSPPDGSAITQWVYLGEQSTTLPAPPFSTFYKHDNILDNEEVVSLIQAWVAPAPSSGGDFVVPPEDWFPHIFSDPSGSAQLVGIHSPVQPAGMSDGSDDWWYRTNPSVPMWRLGSSVYFVLKPGESIDLVATGRGGATLSFSPVNGDETKPPTLLTHIPVTPSSLGTITLDDASASFSWDANGDGFAEITHTIDTTSPTTTPLQAPTTTTPLVSDWEQQAQAALEGYLTAIANTNLLLWRKRLYARLVRWSGTHLSNRSWRLAYSATRAGYRIFEQRFIAGDITSEQYATLEPHFARLLRSVRALFLESVHR